MEKESPFIIAKSHPGLNIYTIEICACLKAIVQIHVEENVFYANVFEAPLSERGPDMATLQTGKGYSGRSAVADCIIDGVKLYAYKTADERTKKLAHTMQTIDAYHPRFEILKKQARKIGAEFCGWDKSKGHYTQCYYAPGFDRLRLLGYDITQVF